MVNIRKNDGPLLSINKQTRLLSKLLFLQRKKIKKQTVLNLHCKKLNTNLVCVCMSTIDRTCVPTLTGRVAPWCLFDQAVTNCPTVNTGQCRRSPRPSHRKETKQTDHYSLITYRPVTSMNLKITRLIIQTRIGIDEFSACAPCIFYRLSMDRPLESVYGLPWGGWTGRRVLHILYRRADRYSFTAWFVWLVTDALVLRPMNAPHERRESGQSKRHSFLHRVPVPINPKALHALHHRRAFQGRATCFFTTSWWNHSRPRCWHMNGFSILDHSVMAAWLHSLNNESFLFNLVFPYSQFRHNYSYMYWETNPLSSKMLAWNGFSNLGHSVVASLT